MDVSSFIEAIFFAFDWGWVIEMILSRRDAIRFLSFPVDKALSQLKIPSFRRSGFMSFMECNVKNITKISSAYKWSRRFTWSYQIWIMTQDRWHSDQNIQAFELLKWNTQAIVSCSWLKISKNEKSHEESELTIWFLNWFKFQPNLSWRIFPSLWVHH